MPPDTMHRVPETEPPESYFSAFGIATTPFCYSENRDRDSLQPTLFHNLSRVQIVRENSVCKSKAENREPKADQHLLCFDDFASKFFACKIEIKYPLANSCHFTILGFPLFSGTGSSHNDVFHSPALTPSFATISKRATPLFAMTRRNPQFPRNLRGRGVPGARLKPMSLLPIRIRYEHSLPNHSN